MNAPLFVAAVPGEVTQLPEGTPLLITGIGTLAAAITLTETLVQARAEDRLPSRIINVGTAGALRDEHPDGVFEITQVHKHDFNSEAVPGIAENFLPAEFNLEVSGLLPTAQLATGDTFVEDTQTRDRLAKRAGLVDMEGYAVVAVARRFGVPVTLLKQISDQANEETASGWASSLDRGAHQLSEAVERLGF